jgi:hypothetical protein
MILLFRVKSDAYRELVGAASHPLVALWSLATAVVVVLAFSPSPMLL